MLGNAYVGNSSVTSTSPVRSRKLVFTAHLGATAAPVANGLLGRSYKVTVFDLLASLLLHFHLNSVRIVEIQLLTPLASFQEWGSQHVVL
jgi:hypothetical protein